MKNPFYRVSNEIGVGFHNSGAFVRIRGKHNKIYGFMILVAGHELSYFNYGRLTGLRWNHILRIPGRKRAICW